MTPEQTTGIILRTRLLTESSQIVHWLTRDHGRIATVARGARRPKSPFRGSLDLFFECDFSFIRSRRSELHTLVETKILETHPTLRRHFHLLDQASFWVRILEKSTETDTSIPEIHEIFREYLKALANPAHGIAAFCLASLTFLQTMGLASDWKKVMTASDPKRNILFNLLESGWTQLEKPSEQQDPLRMLAEWTTSLLDREFGPLKKPLFPRF